MLWGCYDQDYLLQWMTASPLWNQLELHHPDFTQAAALGHGARSQSDYLA